MCLCITIFRGITLPKRGSSWNADIRMRAERPSERKSMRFTFSNSILSVGLLTLFLLAGCNTAGRWDTASGKECEAQCEKFSNDGERCVRWVSTAPDACIREFSYLRTSSVLVSECCTVYGVCLLNGQIPDGSSCICPTSNNTMASGSGC